MTSPATTKTLTDEAIIDAILEMLAMHEGQRGRQTTSPTEVCERLQKLGYTTLAGRHSYTKKPIPEVFDRVWEVARANFNCRLPGNTRYIGL